MAVKLPNKEALKANMAQFEATTPGFTAACFALAKLDKELEIDMDRKPVNPHFSEKFSCLSYRLIHQPDVLRRWFGITMSANLCVIGRSGGSYGLSIEPEFKDLYADIERQQARDRTNAGSSSWGKWVSGLLGKLTSQSAGRE